MGLKDMLIDLLDRDKDGDVGADDLMEIGKGVLAAGMVKRMVTEAAGQEVASRLCPADGATGAEHRREWIASCQRTADSNGWNSTASQAVKDLYDAHPTACLELMTMGIDRAIVGVKTNAGGLAVEIVKAAAEAVGINV